MAPTPSTFTKGLLMKYSTQDLLLADRLARIASELKDKDAALRFPFGTGRLADEVKAGRSAWKESQPDREYILRALAALEEVAAMVTAQP